MPKVDELLRDALSLFAKLLERSDASSLQRAAAADAIRALEGRRKSGSLEGPGHVRHLLKRLRAVAMIFPDPSVQGELRELRERAEALLASLEPAEASPPPDRRQQQQQQQQQQAEPAAPLADLDLDDLEMAEPEEALPRESMHESMKPREEPGEPYTVVPVFYATDRRKNARAKKPDQTFSGARGPAQLRYGKCDVSIPHDRRIGELPRPSIWKFQFREDPKKHVVVLQLTEQEPVFFFDDVARHGRGDALVFVHGYCTTFGDAVRRTAQLAYDLQFEGAAIAYTWPSRGKLAGYLTDENNVQWSVPHLEQFFADLGAHGSIKNVHLIAHSMGSRVLSEAVTRAVGAQPAGEGLFRQIVLAAPDIDADVFRDLAKKFHAGADRVTLYASSKDEALAASRKVHGGYPRAGESGDGIVVLPGVDTIDASAVDTSLLGHSYYGDNRSVISDLFHVLRQAGAPGDRFGMEELQDAGGLSYWRFRP